jgi:hypothetical protein
MEIFLTLKLKLLSVNEFHLESMCRYGREILKSTVQNLWGSIWLKAGAVCFECDSGHPSSIKD